MYARRRSRREGIRALTFLCALFLVAGGFALAKHAEAKAYRIQLQNSYQHAFAEFTTAVSELDTALQKGIYASSVNMISASCTEIFGKAMAAQMAIGELPYSYIELEQTATLIAKIGDYALALSKQAMLQNGYSDEDRATLRTLSKQCGGLAETLIALQADIHNGAATLEDLDTAAKRLSQATENGAQNYAGGSYQTIESELPETPSLIYDGPFSEHIASRSPKMLEGRPQVTEEEAKRSAADFLGLRPEIFTLISAGEGRVPTYGFSAMVDGGELFIEVTRAGGIVAELLNSRPVQRSNLSPKEAVSKAAEFLDARGYASMKESYYIAEDNILTINFAALQGDVTCYTDLIKVSVALDTGSLVGFESEGYLMNHTVRELGVPEVPPETANGRVYPDLEVLSRNLALIPTAGKGEVLCYEFKCRAQDGRHYIIYVNAKTGYEEKILILIEDEAGTLTR